MSMSLRHEIRRAALLAALVLLATMASGCGSGGGSGGGVLPADFTALFTDSGTSGAANVIRLSGSTAGDLVNIEVVIGGPSAGTDFYSFAFDLVLGDPTVAEYVDGSATLGSALTAGGGQALQVLATPQGARTTVGVTKLGGGTGNGVTDPGETVVVSLVFRALRQDTTTLTIEGSPGNDPAALDSVGGDIDSVTFDTQAATLGGV